MLLLSIIVNNHNYGPFLRAAIDSALSQSYHPVEVIVVDDGSTDDSRDIIRSYGDRVTPILKENGGQASALNAGFAHSQGEIILFLDSDDVLLPETTQRAADVFRTDPRVSKVMYRMEIIDALDARTGVIKPAEHFPLQSGDLSRQVLTFPFDMTWMPTSGNAFAARVLRQIFPIPAASFSILADFYLSHLTPLFGPVVFLDRVGAYYRVHDRNSYEVSDHVIDFEHIRRTIAYATATCVYIDTYACQLGLSTGSKRAHTGSSVSIVANRLILLKLDRAHHPIPTDSVGGLFGLGVSAALGRFDVAWPMRLLFVLWFLAMVLAPSSLARWLAERFLYPERRVSFNQVLRLFHSNK